MAVNPETEIRRAVDGGKVVFGTAQSEKSILKGKAQLVIISANILAPAKEKLLALSGMAEIPHFEYEGSGKSLGSVCGKPFTVSVMAVENPGKSKVLDIAKASK